MTGDLSYEFCYDKRNEIGDKFACRLKNICAIAFYQRENFYRKSEKFDGGKNEIKEHFDRG